MKLVYGIVLFFLNLVSRIPLRILFLVSDILYFIVYYIVQYRKKVVRKNLNLAFPDKTIREIKFIEKKFYRHFVDLIFETLKMSSIRPDEVKNYICYKNLNQVKEILIKEGPTIAAMGHYGNWEWLALLQVYTPDVQYASLYKPLHNSFTDQFVLKLRSRMGTFMIPMNNALRQLIQFKNQKRNTLTCFISDQSPLRTDIQYWDFFLNTPAPMYTGVGKIANMLHQQVYYVHIEKVRRGFYEVDLLPVSKSSDSMSEEDIVDQITLKLEEKINENPEYWLWSHKRWKHIKSFNRSNPKYRFSKRLSVWMAQNNHN